MRLRAFLPLIGLLALAALAVDAGDAFARARGGGSRGSRSYSAPAQPSTPSSPSRAVTQPAPTPAPQQRPGIFGGLMGGLAGFMLGGLLGSLLFGGLGHGFGIGLFELVLLGLVAFFVYRMVTNRRAQTSQPAYAMAGGGTAGGQTVPVGGVAVEAPAGADDLGRGFAHVRQMDPSFDPAALEQSAMDTFRNVQIALGMREVGALRNRLTPEMLTLLQGQCDELKAAGRTNHMEQMNVERASVSEVWQERGQDFVTVYLAGSLLDWTVDASGAVVAGSRTTPGRFEEYWTFTRPVGPNPWRLTAIQPA